LEVGACPAPTLISSAEADSPTSPKTVSMKSTNSFFIDASCNAGYFYGFDHRLHSNQSKNVFDWKNSKLKENMVVTIHTWLVV
jgi:hypothetical protein